MGIFTIQPLILFAFFQNCGRPNARLELLIKIENEQSFQKKKPIWVFLKWEFQPIPYL